MSSKIEQLIDEIEEYIDGCKYQALSNTKIIVNKEEIDADGVKSMKSNKIKEMYLSQNEKGTNEVHINTLQAQRRFFVKQHELDVFLEEKDVGTLDQIVELQGNDNDKAGGYLPLV